MSFVATLKENGQNTKKLLPSQIKKREIQHLTLKFTVLLLLTNCLTYLLFSTPQEKAPMIETQGPSITIPENFLPMTLPLKLRVNLSQDPTPITIMNNNGVIICHKAFLISDEVTAADPFSQQEGIHSKIYVNPQDLSHLIESKQSSLWAFPYSEKLKQPNRSNKYEIIF